MCALTFALCIGMAQFGIRRLQAQAIRRTEVYAFAQSAYFLALALASALLNYAWFFKGQKLTHALHLYALPTACVLMAPVLLEAVMFVQNLKERDTRIISRYLHVLNQLPVRLAAAFDPPAEQPSRRRWLDMAALFIIFMIVYSPRTDILAGYIFQTEHFHHWDFFVMGPAIGYLHGQALCTQVYTQYGIGFPVLFALLNPIYSLSYGHMLQFTAAYACLYFWGGYLFLRVLLRSSFWAMLGTLLFIYYKMFMWTLDWLPPWQLPSNTILRAPFDIWFLLALLMHQRSLCKGWLYAVGALAGLSLLFETDTGIYIVFTFAVYSLLSTWFTSSHAPGALRPRVPMPGRPILIAWLIAAGTLLSGMAIGSRGTLLQPAFWRGWLECFSQYPSGISMMPVSEHFIGMLYGMPIIGVYLFMLCYHFQKLVLGLNREESETRPEEATWNARPPLLLLCVALYGSCTMLHYMGRSHPSNLYVGILCWTLLLTVGLRDLTAIFFSAHLRRLSRRNLRIMAALALCLLYALMWKRDEAFRAYPNPLRLLHKHVQPKEISLYVDDAGKPFAPIKGAHPFFIKGSESEPLPLYEGSGVSLPVSLAGKLQQYTPVIAEIKAYTQQGKTTAILANDETWMYLASGTTLWYRYTPVICSMITLAMREDLERALAARPVDYVYIEARPPLETFVGQHPLALYTSDTWWELKRLLPRYYVHDHNVGIYEAWRRR